MGCRCEEMNLLTEKMGKLIEIGQNSSLFKTNINSGRAEQESLKKDSWSATESTTLKNDIDGKLPEMTDKIEEAHEELLKEMEKAMCAMNAIYERLKEEDSAYHALQNNN